MSAGTFYGPISFDDRGSNVAKPTGTVQVQGGQIHAVAPEAAAVAELRGPRGSGYARGYDYPESSDALDTKVVT